MLLVVCQLHYLHMVDFWHTLQVLHDLNSVAPDCHRLVVSLLLPLHHALQGLCYQS